MKQVLSYQVDSCSASQVIPRVLWKPNVHYSLPYPDESVQLHFSAALNNQEKELPIATWAPESSWTFWKKKKSVCSAGLFLNNH
jgi:hypothetical protein